METGEGPLHELDPDSTVDERRISVVDNDSGSIERGGSHRSRLREREGGMGMGRKGRRGFFPCNGGCAIRITGVRCCVVGAFDHFTDHRFTWVPFSKIPGDENVGKTHRCRGQMRTRKDKSRATNSKPKRTNLSVSNRKTQREMMDFRER